MASVDLQPKGSTFCRAATAAALFQLDHEGLVAFAGKRWGPSSKATTYAKAAVGSAGIDDAAAMAEGARDFLAAAAPMTVLGRATGWRFVEPRVPVAVAGDDATAQFVRESEAIPVSKQVFDRWNPKAHKVGTIVVMSKDLLRSADPRSEAVIRGDLLRAAAQATDAGMFNPAGDGTDGAPVSLTYNVVPVTHDGTLPDAVRSAIAAFTGDLMRAFWVVNPVTSAGLGVDSPILAATSDLGARGGSLAGLPAYASAGVPLDELVLVDPGMVAVLDESIEYTTTDAATLELRDDPAMDSQAPTGPGAGHEVVSLFQTDDVGIKLIRLIGWKARAGAVARIELETSST